MKTADLIPFILLELNESNKYGFELTKAIENKSQGKILIKQPTLYTLLKKLEKSKFITSYWEDSEIGGKRHYYKLTENGKLQVSTLPSYENLMQNAMKDDEGETSEESNELLNAVPAESVIPSSEVFADNNIDNATELEINSSNIEILKNETISQVDNFISNESVSKFTEKVSSTNIQSPVIDVNTSDNNLFSADFNVDTKPIDIKYVDYVDFKNTPAYKTSKSTVKRLLWQSLATSGALVFMSLLCYLITAFTGRSPLFYCFFIGALLIALFYPLITLANMENKRLKYQIKPYTKRTKLKLYIGLTLFLASIILCVTVNIYSNINNFGSMLSIYNFANMYAPLLITCIYFLDICYNHLFISKLNK